MNCITFGFMPFDRTTLLNTQAHKRKLIPDIADFSAYSTAKGGQWILKNAKGLVLYGFKSESDKKEKAQAIINSLMELFFEKDKEYRSHYLNHKHIYDVKTYEEANIIHKAIYKGFEACGYAKEINPYLNWFGCSLYSPDLCLKRDGKEIVLSLQGIYTRFADDTGMLYKELLANRAVKYLAFIDGGRILYEDWTGRFPNDQFLLNFIE